MGNKYTQTKISPNETMIAYTEVIIPDSYWYSDAPIEYRDQPEINTKIIYAKQN